MSQIRTKEIRISGSMSHKELKKIASGLSATIQVGKNGITQGTITEIDRQLKKKKLIKIKFLRSFIDECEDKELAALELAHQTKSTLLAMMGFTVLLYRQSSQENTKHAEEKKHQKQLR